MSWPTTLGIAVALAMDAFAVAVACGVAIQNFRLRHALTVALWFGIFQGVMPLAGWTAGLQIRDWVRHVDHWIAFGLLAAVGGKMVIESFRIERVERERDPTRLYVLFSLALATSVDAAAAGVLFAVQDVSILRPVLAIAGVTFALSFAGVWIGNRGRHVSERKMELAAGVLLIAIGLKILIEHLCGAAAANGGG